LSITFKGKKYYRAFREFRWVFYCLWSSI